MKKYYVGGSKNCSSDDRAKIGKILRANGSFNLDYKGRLVVFCDEETINTIETLFNLYAYEA